ncbi:hypothetical protein GCM10011519_35510 [Marmoricola endophyticus]|uniref:PPM-type phosphatase domain-containing protein n=1 Tax=Marmoricola endophyticus TaxID=2040280 RepID=A0A917F9L5_9ACTN|nr:protein phosphatase 2C domain-containing protein [Marmoricola endophyticus]GGF58595.1 hypothetical protein GCM10011519_35510 [Marmoricola endophyticus]
MLRFTGDARSESGLVRHGNEDSGFVSSTLLLVADGVGGNAGGEVASATTAWTVARQSLARVGLRPSGVLEQAVEESRGLLADGVRERPDLTGMATTLTALLTDGYRCALAYVGDSRAYQLRAGELRQVTTDHTWVQEAVAAGELTADEAEQHPWRHVVVRSINAERSQGVEITTLGVRPGDRLLLCSDGLSDLVPPGAIAAALDGQPDGRAADLLVEHALRAGGGDNITVVVATAHDVAFDDTDPSGGFVGAVLDHGNVLGSPVVRLGQNAS